MKEGQIDCSSTINFLVPNNKPTLKRTRFKPAVPHTNLRTLRETPVTLPPLPEQRAIAHILGTLDDKIELNRRMNQTLEEMARALFKSWFVDFDPVHAKARGEQPPGLDPAIAELFPSGFVETELGLVPEGWRVETLGEIAENIRRSLKPEGVDPSTPYIGLQHMPQRSITLDSWGEAAEVSSGKSGFMEGEFLFGKLRPYFHKVGIAPLNGVCSTDILVVRPKDPSLVWTCIGLYL